MTHNANVSQTEVAAQITVTVWPRKVTARLSFHLTFLVNFKKSKK